MDHTTIISLVVISGAVLSALFMVYMMVKGNSSQADYRSLMSSSQSAGMSGDGISNVGGRKKHVDYEALERLKESKRRQQKMITRQTIGTKFARAGIFSKAEQARIEMLGPVFAVAGASALLIAGLMFTSFELAGVMALLGALVGIRFPNMYLDSKIKARDEEILYYLPLVIEQIAIGVSSSLDIGPCLGVVVKMADERGSHNVVTELLKHVQFYVKSGASLEEALDEVGTASGHTELSHAFMSLGQVSKHGGEISRQMQELADSVSAMRETKVEERIKTLELVATGPVALVFVGFMIILISGFFIQIKIGMANK